MSLIDWHNVDTSTTVSRNLIIKLFTSSNLRILLSLNIVANLMVCPCCRFQFQELTKRQFNILSLPIPNIYIHSCFFRLIWADNRLFVKLGSRPRSGHVQVISIPAPSQISRSGPGADSIIAMPTPPTNFSEWNNTDFSPGSES